MKIPEMKSGKGENPYNMEIGASIWQHKQWTLSKYGGIVKSWPVPTPRSFCVFGINNLSLEPGDFIMVARDTSNNTKMQFTANESHPLLIEASYIKDDLVAQIKYIEGSRIEVVDVLTTPYGEEGWPKVGGAVAKVLGYNRSLIDEKLTDDVEKAKKRIGTKWAEKFQNGAWLL